MTDSGTIPAASSPRAMDDTELFSRRIPGQGKTQEAIRAASEGATPATGHMGEQIPMETGDGGHMQFGPQPNTVPETYMAPESGEQPPSSEGGVPILPVIYVQPEALDTLLEALRSASIVEEHRTLMGTVIEKIQSTKGRLTESCTSLLTGFEVSNAIM